MPARGKPLDERGELAALVGTLAVDESERTRIHVAIAAAFVFPRVGRIARSAIAFTLGLFGLVAGTVEHVSAVVSGTAAGSDYSGVLFALGGALLLAIAVAPFARGRMEAAG